ncbi:MAG: AMP-binding protein [Actinomycetota bacterium]
MDRRGATGVTLTRRGTDWNFARAWEEIAAVVPDRPAIVTDRGRLTFGAFEDRAERLAGALAERGIGEGDKVAIHLPNGAEYMEAFFAAAKLGAVPVNVNYRYVGPEVACLLDNADARALVFHAAFRSVAADAMAAYRAGLATLLEVGGEEGRDSDDHAPPVTGAEPYESVLAGAARRPAPRRPGGDDLFFLYTGGTTGLPKAVMWRHDDFYVAQWELARPGVPITEPADAVRAGKRAATTLPASPLMHSFGLSLALQTLAGGGTIVLVEGTRFDPTATLLIAARERVAVLGIVGDAFARPLLEALQALDDAGGAPDLSSLKAIVSSGAAWSTATKARLAGRLPGVRLIDSLGSTEGPAARSSTGADDAAEPVRFRAGRNVRVVDEQGRAIVPGSGTAGLLAVGGRTPLGYYKDPEKTARTFRWIDGEPYTVAGDWARVEADGTITLLGRGSGCINTGGEKVFAEEVEDVLRSHPSVADCAVVGVPDERFGEIVVAVVQPAPGHSLDETEARRWCSTRLAGYKQPRAVVTVDDVGRSPAGKLDHPALRTLAAERLGRAGAGAGRR